jgi:hypothetical protein
VAPAREHDETEAAEAREPAASRSASSAGLGLGRFALMTAGKLPAGLRQRALHAADSPSSGGLCDSRVYGLWRGA